MFIETSKGDFIALDTIARITYWSEDTVVQNPVGALVHTDERGRQTFYKNKNGYRIETKRGEKHNVTDPELMALIKKVINHA